MELSFDYSKLLKASPPRRKKKNKPRVPGVVQTSRRDVPRVPGVVQTSRRDVYRDVPEVVQVTSRRDVRDDYRDVPAVVQVTSRRDVDPAVVPIADDNTENLLNVDEDFSKKFISQFDPTSNSSQIKQIIVQSNSNYSWLNLCSDLSREALNKSNQQTFRQSMRQLTTNWKKITAQYYQFCITYTDYEDKLKDSHPLLNETMEVKSDPRIPFTFVMGNRVVIELRTSSAYSQEKLDKLMNYLQTKIGNSAQLDISGIVYSVKGDIPLTYTVNESYLTREKLQSLIEFTRAEFYQSTVTRRELLEVSTKPINLRKYFQPLFEKLAEIKELSLERHNGHFKTLIDSVMELVLKKVELSAASIMQGINYLDHVKFLQNIYTSFLLNKQELSNYMDELVDLMSESNIKSEILQHCNYRKRFEDDWEVSILLNLISTPITKALQKLQNNIKLAFDNQEFRVDKILLTKNLSDEINQELSCIKKHVDDKMRTLRCYEDFMKKNIGVDFSLNISVEGGKKNVLVCPMKNQILMVPACPILTCPKNIRMINSTESTITIEWDFEDDRLVISYRVHYRCVSDGNNSPLHCVNSENKKMVVSNIASGKQYVFRIQAQFKDVLGAPSEESKSFSTRSVTTTNDSMCLICEDEAKNFAFVPCGHMVGEVCAQKLNVCPFCSAPIERKLKLFS